MFLPRIIPFLLLKGHGLVKTIRFKDPRYIGDPINAVRIFNDLEADELAFVDINASGENRTIDPELVRQIGDEAFMPFAVGGGIKTVGQIGELISKGAEKVIINAQAILNPSLIREAADQFGSQSIIVSIDVKKNLFNNYQVFLHSAKTKALVSLDEHIQNMVSQGAGEILINSIDNDGMMQGYDLNLVSRVSKFCPLPVIACGGAGSLSDFSKAYYFGKASAVAAGSRFVFHGPRNAVLVNYPEKNEIIKTFKEAQSDL
jgi:cyclase